MMSLQAKHELGKKVPWCHCVHLQVLGQGWLHFLAIETAFLSQWYVQIPYYPCDPSPEVVQDLEKKMILGSGEAVFRGIRNNGIAE